MPSETEFVVKSSGLSNDSIPADDKEVWLEVLHGKDAGNRIKASYRNSDQDVQEVMESLEDDDVITAKLRDDMGSWYVLEAEKIS